jgi:hypothetical protein
MAISEHADTIKLAATTADQAIDLGQPMVDEVCVVADETTVRIDFDQPTDDSSFPLLTADVPFRIKVNCNKLHASTSSGTANLYVLAVRLNR